MNPTVFRQWSILGSDLNCLAGFGLKDFHLRVAGADLFLEPGSGRVFAMAQENGARFDLADKIQKVLPVGVSSEVEIVDVAAPGDLTSARAQNKSLGGFGGVVFQGEAKADESWRQGTAFSSLRGFMERDRSRRSSAEKIP